MSSAGVLWEQVAQARCENCTSETELQAHFCSLLAELVWGPDEPLAVLWSNGAAPGLIVNARTAVLHAKPILASGIEVWLCGTERPWLIESRWGGLVCGAANP
jgi:hypothetical protein